MLAIDESLEVYLEIQRSENDHPLKLDALDFKARVIAEKELEASWESTTAIAEDTPRLPGVHFSPGSG